jgi:hypothetical protein
MTAKFLVAFDYEKSGLWAYVEADSAQAIADLYPELEVFRHPPDWMTPARQDEIRRRSTYRLDEAPRGLLAMILREREKSQR